MTTFTALHLFAGLGGGALGFQQARARWKGLTGRFQTVAGVDSDAEACADFEALTGAPCVQADIATMTREELVAAAGADAPDVVFMSPPCKGYSGLLPKKQAKRAKYKALNELVLQGVFLVMETWKRAPPKLLLLENVPRITSRGKDILMHVKQLLSGYGYLFNEGYHDCGELGSLAQHRRRYLLVARHQKQLSTFVYHPPKRRVRAVGEDLVQLPMPGDPAAGSLHRIPRLMWKTWVRLALIPAGGDWRALEEFAPADLDARRRWEQHGEKSEGGTHLFKGKYGIMPWDSPARTVIGGPSNGAAYVSDPRIGCDSRPNLLGVLPWNGPAKTITGSAAVSSSNGVAAVADPRVDLHRRPYNNVWRVVPWDAPGLTVAGQSVPGHGNAFAVADPRLPTATGRHHNKLRVEGWDCPAHTVIGSDRVGSGAPSVADPRVPGGAPSVADPRVPGGAPDPKPVQVPKDTVRLDPPPVIIAADGTWHRPLTTLELAALQGLPTTMPDGRPLQLAGRADGRWRERIGNAVPPPAAAAIAEALLASLLPAAAGVEWVMGGGGIWVDQLREVIG